MSNLSDKELDRLSREAADLYEPDHSSLTWSRLEQKLTEQMPERPPDGFRFGRINPYVWGPAVVMLAGISFYFIKNINYSQHSTRTSEPVSKSTPSSAADSIQARGNTIYLDSISSADHSTASDGKNAILPKPPDAIVGAEAKNKKSSVPDQQVPGTDPDADVSATRHGGENAVSATTVDKTAGATSKNSSQDSNVTLVNKNTGKKSPGSKVLLPASAAAAGSLASDETSAGNSGNASGNSINLETDQAAAGLTAANHPFKGSDNSAGNNRVRTQNELPLIVYSGAGLGIVRGNDSLLKLAGQSKVPVPHKSLHLNRSLNFGLAFGPDYTDAGGITNNQLSNNIGITVGYYLTNKLSVNTGIFYSNKFYWSPGHGLNNPPAYQTGGNTTFAYAPRIEYVNGSCNMYEIPLTLRYDIAKTSEKTKFFVNAGLSSYFMIKQTYIYFFHSSGRALAWKTTDDAQANYWFGVGDLSFGLETDMGKGFSFQAEPFFRIPLKQMGLENLKLNSYGFMISFRYEPVLSRTKK
jgi:hypothetical protein